MLGLLGSSLMSDVSLLQGTNHTVLSHSGKQIRPMMVLLLAKAMGEPNIDSCRFAAACELLHNATLMHDDVADESAQRRGCPSVAALLGPNAAVLLGDYWLSKAVELVLSSPVYDKLVRHYSRVLTLLAEGEMLQLEKASTADTDEADYLRIISCKTASLFELTGISAAVSMGSPDSYSCAAASFAHAYGMAFQIKDDILDYAGTAELGKPRGVDIKEQKITLPLLGAMAAAGPALSEEIRSKVRSIPEHPEYAEEISRFVGEYGGIEYASSRLDDYIARAEESLSVFPESQARNFLKELLYYNSFRKK